MAISIAEIARRAGVSRALASRLLNEDPSLHISDEKRTRIMRTIDDAGGLEKIRRRTHYEQVRKAVYNVVIPVNSVNEAAYPNIIAAQVLTPLEEYLRKRHTRLSANYFLGEKVHEFIEGLLDSQDYCDALLFQGKVIDSRIAKLLHERSFPHVSISPADARFTVNMITNHKLFGFYHAIEHLHELGHEKIGYLGPRGIQYTLFISAMLRYQNGVIKEDKFSIFVASEDGKLLGSSLRNLVCQELGDRLDDKPLLATAFICSNDYIALGAVDAMKERGLQVGRDISVVGVDNAEGHGLTAVDDQPILTTLENPFEALARRIGESLFNQITGKQKDIVHEYLPMHLIVRESTGPCRKGQ